jgi:cyanate permease
MILVHVLVALPIALLVGALVARVFDRHTSVVRLPLFFLAIFLGAWSGGLLTLPLQKLAWAAYWVSFFAGGIVIAMLVIVVSMMPYFRKSAEESTKPGTERTKSVTRMEGFLWTLNSLLAAPIVFHHFG